MLMLVKYGNKYKSNPASHLFVGDAIFYLNDLNRLAILINIIPTT